MKDLKNCLDLPETTYLKNLLLLTDVMRCPRKAQKARKNISRRLLADGVIPGSPIAVNAPLAVAGRAYSELYAAIKEHA